MNGKYLFSLLLLIIGVGTFFPINAQKKGDWGELSVSFDNRFFLVSKDLQLRNQTTYIPSLILGAEVRLYSELIAYFDIDINMRSLKGLDKNVNLFGEFNSSNNLVKINENIRENFEFNGPRFNLGFGYRTYIKDWRVTPQLGVGMYNLSSVSLSHELKELGTSNIFISDYNVGLGPNDVLYNIQFRLKAARKVSNRISMNFGISYDLYINKIKMEATCRDYYSFDYEGVSFSRRPHSITCSVGFAFR